MADVPGYITVPGKIPELLQKVRQVGVPDKVTHEWLRQVGLRSSNDRSLIAVLKQVGFVDANGVPTPAWRQYRGQDHQKVLARAVREGYSDLYSMFPNAHDEDPQVLIHWFSEKSSAGQQTVSKSVSTFKKLAAEADFNGLDSPADPPATGIGAPEPSDQTLPSLATVAGSAARGTGGDGVTINVNVQLTLPETAESSVFDAFFKAMREHLLADER